MVVTKWNKGIKTNRRVVVALSLQRPHCRKDFEIRLMAALAEVTHPLEHLQL